MQGRTRISEEMEEGADRPHRAHLWNGTGLAMWLSYSNVCYLHDHEGQLAMWLSVCCLHDHEGQLACSRGSL